MSVEPRSDNACTSTRLHGAARRPQPTRLAMLNRLTDSLDFQGQALQLRSERQRLIASNIANADTPGYIARDMDFAKSLKAATGALPAASAIATSHSGHIGAGGAGLSGGTVRGEL